MKRKAMVCIAAVLALCMLLPAGTVLAIHGETIQETPMPYYYLQKFVRDAAPKYRAVDSRANDARIKAVEYEGAAYLGIGTRVFAYVGFPEGASAESKVPGIVLVHGGGGTAHSAWVQAWVDRGYAAIAMDTEGRRDDGSRNGLYGPANDSMLTHERALNEQWLYHAVSAVILANNLLRADERVDTALTGIMGVSWGSVVTDIAVGVDTRFGFGISCYGGGYLDEGISGFSYYGIDEKAYALWDPSLYLSFARAKMLFINSDHDTSFSPDISGKSAALTGGALTYIAQHIHGQDTATALQDPYIFADEFVSGQTVRATVSAKRAGDEIEISYRIPEGASFYSVTVYKKVLTMGYTSTSRGYAVINEDFHAAKTVLIPDAPNNRIMARIPWSAKLVYVTIVTERNGIIALSSSQILEV
jgi:dienelactone hydrolase